MTDVFEDGIVAQVVLAAGDAGLIRTIAEFRRHNRDAQAEVVSWSPDTFNRFAKSVQRFRDDLERYPAREETTAGMAGGFETIARALAALRLKSKTVSAANLLEALNAPRQPPCFTKQGTPKVLQATTRWRSAFAAAGLPRPQADAAYDTVFASYGACHLAFEALMATLAAVVLSRLSDDMDGLLDTWREYKRATARLDFDDLLYAARDLLKAHDNVRSSLSKRFAHVLVDEFQDTDPLQIEILWRLCGERNKAKDDAALSRKLRPGALFLVGDPKQAIYRFRGADVNAYLDARRAIGHENLLEITANFRSAEPILTFVNARFRAPLSVDGQPGFTLLSPVVPKPRSSPSVVALDVADADGARADQLRDAEAEAVADLCSRLAGHWQVRDKDAKGATRHCRLGDIALLAPVGTDLWRFEQALENRGIAVSTQAGKGFFRRQEVKDLIALARTLADGRDTLALGALLRSPLVGLSETELLDVAEALPPDPERPDRLRHLNLWTDPHEIPHGLARDALEILQSLGRRARSTTPYALLSDAVALLAVRPHLRLRHRSGAERALANVDLFLEMSRAYDVRGLRAFSGEMRANWQDAARRVEGRPDAEEHSVALITIHAAKGLEWPVVIPINMTGAPKSKSGLSYDRRSQRFSVPIFGSAPPDYEAISGWNDEELRRERVRLWYVAATRARDLLVLPRHVAPLAQGAYANLVNLDLASLPPIEVRALGNPIALAAMPAENVQDSNVFAAEAARVMSSHRKVVWSRPSRSEEPAAVPAATEPVFTSGEAVEQGAGVPPSDVVGGAVRGTLLHKLMEETLNLETQDDETALEERAGELMKQMGVPPSSNTSVGINPKELALTVRRTLALSEIVELRPRLVPEHPVFGSQTENGVETLVRAPRTRAYDADGAVDAVVDWKSDVEVDATKLAKYRAQINAYGDVLGARKRLIVLMSHGRVFA